MFPKKAAKMNDNKTVEDKPVRLAMVVGQFNERVTTALKNGALGYLKKQGVEVLPENIISAPGAFEIPLIAKALAKTGRYDGVICIGAVIKGDTAHFEYISGAASQGLMDASLETGVPLSFGILTTYDDKQARIRSRNNSHNKGIEAATACYETVKLLRGIRA